MASDFPAAHSMDTHWFAVDGQGQVALFFTAETGFMPLDAAEAEASELVGIARSLGEESPPGLDDDGDIDDWDAFLEAFTGLGFYHYNYVTGSEPDEVLVPYTLWGTPEAPLHIDQLPPELREQIRQCSLASLVFGDSKEAQPLDHTADQCLSDWPGSCAYLTGDREAVRPVPGREEQYRAFLRDKLKQWTKRRKNLRIEGADPT